MTAMPVAFSIALASVLSPMLVHRIGTKLVVAGGLASRSATCPHAPRRAHPTRHSNRPLQFRAPQAHPPPDGTEPRTHCRVEGPSFNPARGWQSLADEGTQPAKAR